MKNIFFLILILVNVSCEKKKTTKIIEDIKVQKLSILDSIERSYHIGTLNKITGEINKIKYNAFIRDDNYTGYITTENNDTIFKDSELETNPRFEDFDKDGITDILFKSNIEDCYSLIQFNQQTSKFIKVENFNLYPEPTSIKNSKYYYSYHSSGCADYCWESDLFLIENFRTIKIGTISKFDEDLNINKINNSKPFLFKKVKKYEGNKFEFIKRYWEKNYLKFKK